MYSFDWNVSASLLYIITAHFRGVTAFKRILKVFSQKKFRIFTWIQDKVMPLNPCNFSTYCSYSYIYSTSMMRSKYNPLPFVLLSSKQDITCFLIKILLMLSQNCFKFLFRNMPNFVQNVVYNCAGKNRCFWYNISVVGFCESTFWCNSNLVKRVSLHFSALLRGFRTLV